MGRWLGRGFKDAMTKYLPYVKNKTNHEIKGKKISAIYFLRMNRRIIYIGFTKNLSFRISQHKTMVFDDFRFIACEWSKASVYSRRLMRLFKPTLNHKSLMKDKPVRIKRPILKEHRAIELGYWVGSNGQLTLCGEYIERVYINNNGYHSIAIKYDRRGFRILVHRIQAYQKYGDAIYRPGIMVRHLNGIKTDNSYDNIAIGTALDNAADVPIEVRREAVRKATETRMRKKLSALPA